MTDWLSKCIVIYKKPIYLNGWQKERHSKRNRPQQLQTHYVPTDNVKNVNGTD